MQRPPSSTKPSNMDNSRSNNNKMARTVATMSHGSSAFLTGAEKGRGATIAVIPSTNPIFAMFEPIALPTASNGLPSSAAKTATRISGADVPIDTTVKPISILDTPILVANAAAPDRKRSALHTRAIKPSTSSRSGSQIMRDFIIRRCPFIQL